MLIFFDPVFKSSFGWRLNFGAYHQLIGFAIAGVGAVLLYFVLFRKGKDNKDRYIGL